MIIKDTKASGAEVVQKCIVVLGMHRSGTSALSGVLHYLGVDMGKDMMPPSDDNPKGFFENQRIFSLNEMILSDNNMSWDNVTVDFNVVETEKFHFYLKEAKKIIKEQFKFHKVFAIKDPRNSIVFPLWQRALEELSVDVNVVLACRNPLDVAASLDRRNKFSFEKSLLLWAVHILQAERYSRSFNRIVISFDDLLLSRSVTLKKICSAFSIRLTEARKKDINSFLDINLQHHSHTTDDVSAVLPSCLYELMRLQEDCGLDDNNRVDRIYNEFVNSTGLFHDEDIVNSLSQVRSVYAELSDKCHRIVELKEEVEEKNRWALNLEKEVQQSRQLVSEQKDKFSQYEESNSREVEHKNRRIIELQDEVDKKNKWAINLNVEIDDLRKNNSELRARADDVRESSVREIEQKNSRIVELQDEVDKRSKWAIGLNEEVESLRGTIAELRSALSEARETSAREIEHKDSCIVELQREADESQKLIDESATTVQDLEEQLSQSKELVLELNSCIDAERQKHDSMQQTHDEILRDIMQQLIKSQGEVALKVEELSEYQRSAVVQDSELKKQHEIINSNERKLIKYGIKVEEINMRSRNIESYFHLQDKYNLNLLKEVMDLVFSKRKLFSLSNAIKEHIASNKAVRRKFDSVPRAFIEKFNAGKYIDANLDVRDAIISGDFENALEHFIIFGCDEVKGGVRQLYLEVPFFNEVEYLNNYNDVKLAVENGAFDSGFHHFLMHGAHELRENIRTDVRNVGDGIELKLIDSNMVVFNENDRLVVPVFEQPIVSIIIPAYNQANYTYSCIDAVVRHSRSIPYEIIVMDDNSTEDNARNLNRYIDNITFVSNETNLGFLLNCNKGASLSKGQYLLFLNNDTNVQPDWLMPLIELIRSDDSIGMVGSKLVYPDGRQQEAGGIIWNDASGWNFGRLDDPSKPEYNYIKEVDYISGASIMIDKELWDEIGGFDERYVPAYFEDSDLAFEVRNHGRKVMYQPKSVVVHFEGVSHGVDVNSGVKSYQVRNLEFFKEKWNKELKENQYPNAENVFLARDRSGNKPTILFVDHYVPHYDQDAGSRTVHGYLKLFVSEGFNVKFIGDNFFPHQPYTSALQDLGIEVLYGAWYANNWQSWIEDNGRYLNFVFLNRPHISEKYIDVVNKFTDAKIFYYGHDLHFLREEREYQLTHDQNKLASIEQWKEIELSLMRKSDAALYPSVVEVDEIKKLDSSIPAQTIPAYLFESFDVLDRDCQATKDIMFVGGFGHTPNVDAVLWFVENVWDHILNIIPDIKFYIIGSKPTDEILSLACESIIVTGFVSDDELNVFYQKCRVAVVPLRYGAGIKGKIVEALYQQIPVVTTSVGAEGLLQAEEYMVVADSAEDFCQSVTSLYEDLQRLNELSEGGVAYCEKYFSYAAARESLNRDSSWRSDDI